MRRILPAVSVLILTIIFAGCGGEASTSSQDTTPVQTSSSGSVTIANTALQFSETTSISATFIKIDGTPASGINVNFSTTLGSIAPAGAVTDANGTATVQLTAGATSGQGQITASATVENKQVTKTGLFSISLPSLKLSAITLGLSTLSYGGSTSVSVAVTDANGVIFTGQEVDVTFSSTQAASGKANITSPVRTVNGIATVTYQATTVTGSDTITAAIAGDSKTATITVNPLAAGSVSFVSASPTNIGLKGMGGVGIQETSNVTFKVLDTAGQPKANQQVDFALNTTVGGLSLVANSGSTASDGTVSTTVIAGTIATPVRVTASTDVKDAITGKVTKVLTQSDQLVISTGVPAQDGFSISIETLNPESWNTDGVIDKVTARLSDHFHNPVPDGTAVYFTTSGGSIQPSCITVGGACSVNWTSQNPRPIMPNSPTGLPSTGAKQDGRAVILAYAVGEEAFLDLNGNGLADAGEFTDDTEAFRDDNESRVRDANETYIDFNSDGIFNGPDGKYNGVLQGTAYIGAPKSKHVFSNSVIVMASSVAQITNSCNGIPVAAGGSIPVTQAGSTSCVVTVNDVNGNTMPAGTTVSFSYTDRVTGIKLLSDPFTFSNTAANIGAISVITLSDSSVAPAAVGSGILKVSVKSPGGVVTPPSNYNVN